METYTWKIATQLHLFSQRRLNPFIMLVLVIVVNLRWVRDQLWTTRVSLRHGSDTRCCCMLVVSGVVRHIQGSISFVCLFVRSFVRSFVYKRKMMMPRNAANCVDHVKFRAYCTWTKQELQCTSLAPRVYYTMPHHLLLLFIGPLYLTKMCINASCFDLRYCMFINLYSRDACRSHINLCNSYILWSIWYI